MAHKGQFRFRVGGNAGAAVNLSTASFKLTSGACYLKTVAFKLTTTATAGNRQMRLLLKDEAGTPLTVFTFAWAAVQAASTAGYYQAFADVPSDSAFLGPLAGTDLGVTTLAIPVNLIVYDNWTVALIDAAAKDGADQIYANFFLETR